ncbi:hypothetical protein HYQ44_018361 [Verticillium longisporum]|nr:hypothetical protein HYQ44_018361 [Verticillium longisporum]
MTSQSKKPRHLSNRIVINQVNQGSSVAALLGNRLNNTAAQLFSTRGGESLSSLQRVTEESIDGLHIERDEASGSIETYSIYDHSEVSSIGSAYSQIADLALDEDTLILGFDPTMSTTKQRRTSNGTTRAPLTGNANFVEYGSDASQSELTTEPVKSGWFMRGRVIQLDPNEIHGPLRNLVMIVIATASGDRQAQAEGALGHSLARVLGREPTTSGKDHSSTTSTPGR